MEKQVLSKARLIFMQNKKKRIAILGAGIAGLALGYHLSSLLPSVELIFFDPEGIGGGASKVAAGLLHPLGGARASLSPKGLEGFYSAKKLIEAVDQKLIDSCILHKGILRVAVQEEQVEPFKKSYEKNKTHLALKWLNPEETVEMVKGASGYPSLYIEDALAIDVPSYLNGLANLLKKGNAIFLDEKVEDISRLFEFDAIVIASGSYSPSFQELSSLPLRFVKGQGLIFDWPDEWTPLSKALNSKCYIVMQKGKKTCYAGATFERNNRDDRADLEFAYNHLMPLIKELYPPLAGKTPIKVESGIRLTAPNHFPIAKKISNKVYAFAALGSKGLLYHSFLGETLAKLILEDLGHKATFHYF